MKAAGSQSDWLKYLERLAGLLLLLEEEELLQLCPPNSCFHQMVSGFGISLSNICGETPLRHSLLFRLFEVDPECNAQPSLLLPDREVLGNSETQFSMTK